LLCVESLLNSKCLFIYIDVSERWLRNTVLDHIPSYFSELGTKENWIGHISRTQAGSLLLAAEGSTKNMATEII
jgi:hypothetical protein